MKKVLPFPAAILNQHFVVLGKTGAGKSSALRVIVEYLLMLGKRVCVIDPKGDWHGLKVGADGKTAGLPVIAFGDFKEPKATDIRINARAGKHAAELITEGNRPCIIGFRGWTASDMRSFWIDFASTLFNSNSAELYVIVDEVHNFAPKGKILDPRAGDMLHWTNRLLSEGRGLGLVFGIASQRPQKVHNDTLTCCETLIAMRVNHTADRGAVKDWIDGCGDKKQGVEVLNNLAQLQRGEAFVWSPEIGFGPERLKFPMFQTFDSFKPPQLQAKISQSGWSAVNIDVVKERFAEIEEEEKAKDPKELHKQIAALQKELKSKKPIAAVTQPVVNNKELDRAKRLLEQCMKFLLEITTRDFDSSLPKEEVRKALESAIGTMLSKLETVVSGRAKELTKLKNDAHKILKAMESIVDKDIAVNVEIKHNKPFTVTTTPKAPIQQSQRMSVNATEGLTNPEQRILNAIAWMESIGIEQPQQVAVSFLAGYTYGSGGYNNPRGSLRVKGLVEYLPGDKIQLTDGGKVSAQYPTSTGTSEELQQKVLERLPNPEQKVLNVLLETYPEAISKEECANKSGYTPGSGGFNNPCGRLRTLGLCEYPSPGHVRATSLLFI